MNGTMRSGIIFAVVNFVAGVAMGFIFPLCFPLCGLVFGAGAGYLGNMWNVGSSEAPAKVGATAGAIAGVGALIGIAIGILVNYLAFGEANQQLLAEQFDFELPTGPGAEAGQYIGVGITACCIGIGALVMGAAGGAGGAAIQNSMSRGKTA